MSGTDGIAPVELLDKTILQAMTVYGELSTRQLALKLKLPLSTLELRVRKLKEKGVLEGLIYTVNPTNTGCVNII